MPGRIRPGIVSWRAWLLFAIAAAAVSALIAQGPIAQAESYHQFADQRIIAGIPNLWNVASSLPFLAVGLYGLSLLVRGHSRGSLSFLRPAYTAFFAGVVLVAAGSAYYHLHPGNATLVWDRLPMTLAFAAFFVAILGEHVNAGCVRLALVPALVIGLLSVLWWQHSGDLRCYVLIQFLPVILIPAIVLLYPSRLPGARWVWAVLAAYAIAKAFEFLDAPVYHLLGVSGHSLKHIAAAIGVYFVAAILQARSTDAAAA